MLTIQDYKTGSPQTQTFTYDALYRLTSAQAVGGLFGNYPFENYTYNTTTGNLASKAGVNYTYSDASHAHGVTNLSNGNAYQYDLNGNMILRQVGGQTYNLAYDAENRLTQVSGAATASFVYDGDGKRILSVEGGTTTVFIGDYFEWTGTVANAVRYYYAGATRIAMRQGSGNVTWLLGDHLGSTSVSYDGTNDLHQGYKPWGETRFGSVPTGYQYTGQFNQQAIGLYYYGARWYDSYLSRFTSPDTVVTDNYNTLDWDRYQYARSNPVVYIDPNGHNPLAILFVIAVCVVTYLATPETAYAPEAGFTSPTNVDQSSATKAYFDAAPGTGDISDIYTAATGRTLFSGEEVGFGGRILAGAASALPLTASGLKQAGKMFDIVPYGSKVDGLVPHHGVMDVWASTNIDGYVSRSKNVPTILLTDPQHRATINAFNNWRKATTGSITGKIDWKSMSPRETQALAEMMFDAAGVPLDARQAYYNEFYRYLYEELE